MTAAVLPNTSVATIDAAPLQGAALDGTRLFLAMESLRGSVAPMRFRSARDVSKYLERSGVGIPAFDAVDVALREAVPEVWLSRILGPSYTSAHVNLNGPGGNPVLVLTASEPGEWANGVSGGLTAEVVNGPNGGTERQIIVRRAATGATVSASPVFTARTDALAWNALQTTVTVTLGTENALPVVVAPSDFAGGDSDADGITQTEVRSALDRMTVDLGLGQVATPGRGTEQTSAQVLGHAAAFNRTALLEAADGLDIAALTTLAQSERALGSGAEGLPRLGGLWAQHATGPGVISGQTRTVPWTVVQAGLIARLEHAEGHPNVAPFGDSGVPVWATGVTRYFDAADAETLFGEGVNIVTRVFDAPRNGSFRTLEEEGTTEWLDLAHTRTDRAIRADAFDVGRQMGSKVINRKTLNDFAGRLRIRLQDKYWKLGATFGDTPDEAARVDVDSVNDTDTMAAREVNAAVGVRMSEHAEYVNITIAKVPIGQEV